MWKFWIIFRNVWSKVRSINMKNNCSYDIIAIDNMKNNCNKFIWYQGKIWSPAEHRSFRISWQKRQIMEMFSFVHLYCKNCKFIQTVRETGVLWHNEGQIIAPNYMILLWCRRGFLGVLNQFPMMLRDATLSENLTSDRRWFSSVSRPCTGTQDCHKIVRGISQRARRNIFGFSPIHTKFSIVITLFWVI